MSLEVTLIIYIVMKTKARFINDIYPPQSDEIKDKFQIISTISMFYDIHQIENLLIQLIII